MYWFIFDENQKVQSKHVFETFDEALNHLYSSHWKNWDDGSYTIKPATLNVIL